MSVCSSCRPFALDDLDDYEKHFTVMNYNPGVVLKQVGAWRGLGSSPCGSRHRPGPPATGLSPGQAA